VLSERANFLVTGAAGNQGFAVVRKLLERGDAKVTALVRPGTRQRLFWCLRRIPSLDVSRVHTVEGDIRRPFCDLRANDAALESVTDVVHCAADVRWDAPISDLVSANVDGTRNLLDLAEQLHRRSRLNRVTVVSSAFIAGTRREALPEQAIAAPRFNNPYEATKFLAECEAFGRTSLPVNIVRPSIVVGDSRDGVIQNFSTLYHPFRLVLENKLFALPAAADARLDIVPSDYVASVVLALHAVRFGPGRVVHAAGGDTVVGPKQIWDIAAASWDALAPSPLGRKRASGPLLPPALARSFRWTNSALPASARQPIDKLLLFLPYLSSSRITQVGHANAIGVAPAPALATYASRLCEYALAERFKSAKAAYARAVERGSTVAPPRKGAAGSLFTAVGA
jgi:nucleoside-diphosphate-sugar epimerase